jgi:hypothetical protein
MLINIMTAAVAMNTMKPTFGSFFPGSPYNSIPA